jgi:hypothetical protein
MRAAALVLILLDALWGETESVQMDNLLKAARRAFAVPLYGFL